MKKKLLDFVQRLKFTYQAFKLYDKAVAGIILDFEYRGSNPWGDEELVASKFRFRFLSKKTLKTECLPLRPITRSGDYIEGSYPTRGEWESTTAIPNDKGFTGRRSGFRSSIDPVKRKELEMEILKYDKETFLN